MITEKIIIFDDDYKNRSSVTAPCDTNLSDATVVYWRPSCIKLTVTRAGFTPSGAHVQKKCGAPII